MCIRSVTFIWSRTYLKCFSMCKCVRLHLFNRCSISTLVVIPELTLQGYYLNLISSTVPRALKCAWFANKQWPCNLCSDFKQKLFKENGSLSEVADKRSKGRMMGVSRQFKHLYCLIIHSNAVIRLHWNLQRAISTIWTHQMEITDWQKQSAF